MIPLWFLPYAIACGNTFVLKPSERVPLTQRPMVELLEQTRPAAGRGQSGQRRQATAVDAHAAIIRASAPVSFVGSTPVARYVYARGAARRQARAVPGRREELRRRDARRGPGDGGADHRPTAPSAAPASAASPASCAIPVGDAHEPFTRADPGSRPRSLRVGNGLERGVQMGPVIIAGEPRRGSRAHRATAAARARRALVDGRGPQMPDRPRAFRRPDGARRCRRDESLGADGDLRAGAVPAPASDLDEAIDALNAARTATRRRSSPRAARRARKFRYEAQAGNIGINIGVAAPMAYSRSAAGRTASSACCTARAGTASSSTRTRKSWSSGGRRSGRVNSEAPCQVVLQTGFSVLSGSATTTSRTKRSRS